MHCAVDRITIYKGSDRNFSLRIEYANGDPFILAGVTQIEVIFKAVPTGHDGDHEHHHERFFLNDGSPEDFRNHSPGFSQEKRQRYSALILNMTSGQVMPDSSVQGKINVIMSNENSSLLLPGSSQSFEVVITIADVVTVVQFLNKLDVIERIFPGK